MLLLSLCGGVSAAISTRAPETPPPVGLDANSQVGCCVSGVQHYGNDIDFTSQPEGTPITDQYGAMGVLFGTGATPLAAETVVQIDYSRAPDCRHVLNGDPPFQGWEFLVFANPSNTHWCKVQRVGALIGYCDRENSVFLAAYDWDDNLLEVKFNDTIGFQFISVERPTADICKVLIGDCVGGGGSCYPDPAGSALNCLTFSTPVATAQSLPDTISMPAPPLIQGTPGVGGIGLVALSGLLAVLAIVVVSRRRNSDARAF